MVSTTFKSNDIWKIVYYCYTDMKLHETHTSPANIRVEHPGLHPTQQTNHFQGYARSERTAEHFTQKHAIVTTIHSWIDSLITETSIETKNIMDVHDDSKD